MSSIKSMDSLLSMGELQVENDDCSRAYPSITDYYNASSTEINKPLQLQSGLSNYSSLVLGDDRISVSESIMNATYRSAVENKMTIESPSKAKSTFSRRREYKEAFERVGKAEVDRLERVMKDKLVQRSLKTSSAFQVNKAFKFFDREQCLRIPIEGFTRALEFLGFQFSEIQNLALFARYDTEFEGEIIYMDFISNAMFFHPSDDMMAPRSIKVSEENLVAHFGSQEVVDDLDSIQVILHSFLCSFLMPYWTSLCVLRGTCRQE
jgi:hypothetical protein